jgi:hypothetical protein
MQVRYQAALRPDQTDHKSEGIRIIKENGLRCKLLFDVCQQTF